MYEESHLHLKLKFVQSVRAEVYVEIYVPDNIPYLA